MKKVIIELIEDTGFTLDAATGSEVAQLDYFSMDRSYDPVSIGAVEDSEEALAAVADGQREAVLIRGEVEEDRIAELEALPNVFKVWDDGRIEVFCCDGGAGSEGESEMDEDFVIEEPSDFDAQGGEAETDEAAFDLELASPCPPTDCASGTPKGTIAEVAKYLRVNRLWNKGIRGAGVTIGIVDSGVNKTKVPAFAGGW